MNTLETILTTSLVDDVWHTHTSMMIPKGKYVINNTILPAFWDKYNTTILSNSRELGLTEKPQTYIPILVDVDLKKREEDSDTDECYTIDIVQQLVSIYQSVLRDIVEDCTDKQLLCVFLSKKPYKIRTNGVTYVKHGFHSLGK